MYIQQKLPKILIIGFVFLVLIVAYYFFYITQLPKTSTYEGIENIMETEAEIYEDASIINGHKVYRNTTIGISFDYAPEWRFEKNNESSEDPITHGDIMSDGKIYNSFHKALFSPDWKTDSTYIDISHTLLSHDNLSIEEQFNKIRCVEEKKSCKESINPNGVKYVRYAECGEFECISGALIPTGKYIVGLALISDTHPASLSNENVLDNILKSLKLE